MLVSCLNYFSTLKMKATCSSETSVPFCVTTQADRPIHSFERCILKGQIAWRIYPFSKSSVFWDVTPCGLLKVNQRFGGTCRLHLQSRRISTCFHAGFLCLAYSSTLNIEATCFSETSMEFQTARRRYIPEDRTLYNHLRENLNNCYKFFPVATPCSPRKHRRFGDTVYRLVFWVEE
jgi:hypothetical protein